MYLRFPACLRSTQVNGGLLPFLRAVCHSRSAEILVTVFVGLGTAQYVNTVLFPYFIKSPRAPFRGLHLMMTVQVYH